MTLELRGEPVRILLIEDDATETELLRIELERRSLALALHRVDT